MVIVILNKRPLTRMRYQELFPNATLHLLTSLNHTSKEDIEAVEASYASISTYEQYDGNGVIEARVLEIAKTEVIDRIIALSEQDILRAAKLRDLLNIDGMRYSEALAYRDKGSMKQRLSNAGVPVAAFAILEHASDALVFADQHSYPLVLKPTRGAGSMGVVIVHDAAQLTKHLALLFTADFDRDPGYMVESFVDGEMYHIDGLVHQGKVIFSRASKYINSCLSFQDGFFLGSAMLDPDGPMSATLNEICHQTINALQTRSSFAFHAEVFQRSQGGDLLVCEIACRAGGGPIVDTIITATGIDLTRTSALLELDAESATKALERPYRNICGFCIFPPQKGVLKYLPKESPLPSVIKYQTIGKEGAEYSGGQNSIDCVATAMVTAINESACASAVSSVARWFDNNVIWDSHTRRMFA